MFNQNSNDLVKQASQQTGRIQNSLETKNQILQNGNGNGTGTGNRNGNMPDVTSANIVNSQSNNSPDNSSSQFTGIIQNILNYTNSVFNSGDRGANSQVIPSGPTATINSPGLSEVPPLQHQNSIREGLLSGTIDLSSSSIDTAQLQAQQRRYTKQTKDNAAKKKAISDIIIASNVRTRNNWVKVKDPDGLTKYGYITKNNIFQPWTGATATNPSENWLLTAPVKNNNGVLGCPAFPASVTEIEISEKWNNIKPFNPVFSISDTKTPVFIVADSITRNYDTSSKNDGLFSCGNEVSNVAVKERPAADFDVAGNGISVGGSKQGCYTYKNDKKLDDLKSMGFNHQTDLGPTTISNCKRRAEDLGRSVFFMASPKSSRETVKIPDNTQNMYGYRGKTGPIYEIKVTGRADGAVWGTNVFTDDSSIAKAAVNAGVIKIGETKTVYIEVLPSKGSYQNSDRNSTSTWNYGNWGGSYQFVNPDDFDDANAQSSNYMRDCYIYSKSGYPNLENILSKDDSAKACHNVNSKEMDEDGFMKAYDPAILPRLYGKDTKIEVPAGPANPTCDHRTRNGCIFPKYNHAGGAICYPPNWDGTWAYGGLYHYSNDSLKGWLNALEHRNGGGHERPAVQEYKNRCKDTAGYEFLQDNPQKKYSSKKSVALYTLKSSGGNGVDTLEPEQPGMIGKIAHITYNGKLREYPRSLLKTDVGNNPTEADVAFMEVGMYDTRSASDSYDIGGVENISYDECKKRCAETKNSGGFVFTGPISGGAGKCQLKNKDTMFPIGLRKIDQNKRLVLKLPGLSDKVSAGCRAINNNKYIGVDSLQYTRYLNGKNMNEEEKCDIVSYVPMSTDVAPVDLGPLLSDINKREAQVKQSSQEIRDRNSSVSGIQDAGAIQGFTIREGLGQLDPTRSIITATADLSNSLYRIGDAERQKETINAFKDESNVILITQSYKFILWTILAILAVIGVMKIKEKITDGVSGKVEPGGGEDESVMGTLTAGVGALGLSGLGDKATEAASGVSQSVSGITDSVKEATESISSGVEKAVGSIIPGSGSGSAPAAAEASAAAPKTGGKFRRK